LRKLGQKHTDAEKNPLASLRKRQICVQPKWKTWVLVIQRRFFRTNEIAPNRRGLGTLDSVWIVNVMKVKYIQSQLQALAILDIEIWS
jgi:hypothetical protein